MLSHINVGAGEDVTIAELAETVKTVTGFQGEIAFDRSRPDGTARKLMDVSRLGAMGWRATVALRDGLTSTYSWYLENHGRSRAL
jgi:GDP-L-fucose synthase